jgi:hypothetical protein
VHQVSRRLIFSLIGSKNCNLTALQISIIAFFIAEQIFLRFCVQAIIEIFLRSIQIRRSNILYARRLSNCCSIATIINC